MLSAQHCSPAPENLPAITPQAAMELLAQIPGWNFSEGGKSITRNFNFKNYADALKFVQEISAIAEAENHHPDVSFGWGYAGISFTTHNIGGLHMNDFIMAAKLNECD